MNSEKELANIHGRCRSIAMENFKANQSSDKELNSKYQQTLEQNISEFYNKLVDSLVTKKVTLHVQNNKSSCFSKINYHAVVKYYSIP